MRAEPSIAKGATTVRGYGMTYRITPGVIDALFAEGWLVQGSWQHAYVLNPDRENEWRQLEAKREVRARNILKERIPSITLKGSIRWDMFHHPHSPEMDSRGFVFTSTDGFEYLVCEAGRVMPVLKTMITHAEAS